MTPSTFHPAARAKADAFRAFTIDRATKGAPVTVVTVYDAHQLATSSRAYRLAQAGAA